MTRVRLATGVIENLDVIADHLLASGSDAAEARADEIISAFEVLADNPLIGRPRGNDKRELVIGHGTPGCIALYRYLPLIDMVLILAIRAQREGSYVQP